MQLAQGSLDATGHRLAQLVFRLPALQLVFGGRASPALDLLHRRLRSIW
jgi:hypothetical protein